MSGISPEQARAYLKRWELVREFEAAEMRRTPLALKLRQLAALMNSRGMFESERDAGIRAVRERWSCLRRTFGA
jgi:hypothetical protein